MQAECRIFIDDERNPPPGDWLIARSETQFAELLRINQPSVIAFDHDLGFDDLGHELPTGQHCMRRLIDAALDRPEHVDKLRLVILHSANPVGRANMRGLLESAQRHGILSHARLIERPVTSYPLARWPLI